MADWSKIGRCFGAVAGGALLGHYGVKILSGKDAKTAYTHCTAAVLRMKDEVMKDVENIRENAEDSAADAREINEERRKACEAQMIEDAKELLEKAQAQPAE